MNELNDHKPLFSAGWAQAFLILPLAALLFPFVQKIQTPLSRSVLDVALAVVLAIGLSLGFLTPYFWFQILIRKRGKSNGAVQSGQEAARKLNSEEISVFTRLIFAGMISGTIALCVIFLSNR